MILAFYKGRKRFVNRAIADLTDGPYSHVEIVLQHLGKGFFLCLSSSMMDGGVRCKVINLNAPDWVLVSVKTAATEADAIAWYLNNWRMTYDYFGALRYRVPFLRNIESKAYCSEVVYLILGLDRAYHPNGLYQALMPLMEQDWGIER